MAKSRSIGGIYASLSLRDQGFKAGLKNAGKSLAVFANRAAIGAAGAAVAGGTLLAAGARKTLSMIDDLNDVSRQTGFAVDDMMILQQAYSMGGRAAEMAGKDIAKMQRSIVGAAAGGSDPFASMGMNAKDLIRLDPAEQFKQIGEAIMKISNPAERTATAMEIFGKGGMGLTTVFEGIPDAVSALGSMPQIAAEFADRMGEANDLIGNLPQKSNQFFVGFTAGIVDEILPGLDSINEYDFTMLGKILGDTLGDVIKVWAISANTIFDGITGGWDFDFDAAWNKYSNAQTDLESGDQENRLNKDIEKANKKKIDKLNEFHPEDFEVSGKIFDKMMESMRDVEMDRFDFSGTERSQIADRQVNSYQSRGLSMDAIPNMGRAVETTNSILATIRDILKNTQTQGIGNW